MKKILLLLFLAAQPLLASAQTGRTHLQEKIDTANLNLRALGEQITVNDRTDYEKARSLLGWVSNRPE